uniref:CD3e molecule, epsilon associated protein n=1 Tax=Oryzias latipes TaxID=8090 RepID=A0A3P9HH21_ORYLA
MPKDVSSSSSSEDEAENPAPETAEPPKQPDFVSFRHVACSGAATDALKDDQKELWLIKAPVSFDPRRYELPSDQLVLAPPFSGQLNVCESYGDSSTNQNPQVIPASPAPSVPPGLKQRFLPFGSRTPTLTEVGEEEVEGTMRPLVAAEGGGSVDEEEGRKRRKKKKKQIKTEKEVEVKQEPVDEMDEPPKKRKKKKKREMEEGLAASVEVKAEPLSVKLEPPDAWCDGAPTSGKKKKKKALL